MLLTKIACHYQRIVSACERQTRVTQCQHWHTRFATILHTNTQQLGGGAPFTFLDVVGYRRIFELHGAAFGFVAQYTRDNFRYNSPTGKHQPLGRHLVFKFGPRAFERVIRQRRRQPKQFPPILFDGLCNQAPESRVTRVEWCVVFNIAPVQQQGRVISSSRVRGYIRAGDVAAAARCLGRPLRIPGTVEPGAGRGRSIGVPTANLTVWPERACPAAGVYAAFARIDEKSHAAVVNVGLRPTFEDGSGSVTIEAHLLDFNDDLYGRSLALDFIAWLRAERKFPHAQAYGAQIEADLAAARALLANVENEWHLTEKYTF